MAMARTVRDRLLEALDDLTEGELQRFKAKLRDFPVPEGGYSHIPRGRLEKADPVALADLLFQFYTEAHAPRMAAGVLEAIGCKPQAERLLLGATGNDACSKAPLPFMSASAVGNRMQATVPREQHFIDQHREALIQRTATVEGILDMLYGTILDDEQYQAISAKTTSQEKMRELYKLVPSWNRDCKDRLYKAIKMKNKFLIDDLEGQP
uniref:Apoptosis-associated speck-like protein containing a CARD isoform X1 n=1 Tax=Pogona vitticeps TaxID=103695 RepID=A0A6J0UQE8_9SAUR